ncbi:chemotaxis response regulator protein-glutamate methylesterase [Treponema ruminis]|uniref:Protein-glutamate methylesterase/protein-glutamine glutaminase n=1 Tax=Treponema ruminis TaxID=744515 RepID=A0A7W8G921_9SPIR|nr:chemotaxis response regulator protein-glutamate methylesterase [Treponema ruminis]MBB5226088.1 two-component system chemotaxis response regulator CheB [Treponema ruminis]QSI03003.1 chemotaxis response regulator protein-glutamate methylesterase [Treponema ruminis]
MEDISVAICDDSALMRNLISRVIDETEGLTVAGKAMNGKFLVDKLALFKPDVIVLDIEMPEMTGVEFLRWRKQNKVDIPVIILSSIAEKGAAVTIECLELGAADFITKPNGSISADISSVSDRLIELISSYGGSYARRHGKQVRTSEFFSNLGSDRLVERKLATAMGKEKAQEFLSSSKDKASQNAASAFASSTTPKAPAVIEALRKPGKIEVIAIGISTGGPNALRDVFKMIDPHLKQPVLVVQHMPAGFTKEFANSLNKICALNVKEAEDNEPIEGGTIYIAPGNYHIYVEQTNFGKKMLRLSQEPQRNGHRPSADVLFESVAKVYQNHALGVIMTGMGKDGAVELAEMRKQGAWTLGQDEATAIVYGMPKVAYELGGVQKQVPLDKMADEISKLARENA